MTTTPASRPAMLLRSGPAAPVVGRLHALGLDEVRISGGFWSDIQSVNAAATLAHCEHWLEVSGWLPNFDRVREAGAAEARSGWVFADSEVYKLLEAMAWELGRQPDAALAARYDAIVERVLVAQDDDGYLGTAFGHAGQPGRYTDLEHGHELYCAGHFLQAAVARLRTGNDDRLVEAGRRLADHVVREFGPSGRDAVCGHPNIEDALVEFGRATGEQSYLATARALVERRGRGLLGPIDFGSAYFQDDMPVRKAAVLRGHAVRALYLSSGAYGVATDTDDAELRDALLGQWDATIARRTYITGGMGSRHEGEAYGDDYELPSDQAYSETCAGVASVMLSWRMLLDTGDVRFSDAIERTILNNVLAGRAQDGDSFFYVNTLQQRSPGVTPDPHQIAPRNHVGRRAPWFDVSCCPTNLARLIASAGLYLATRDQQGVQVHQYGDLDIDTVLDDGRAVSLAVRSGYPYDGDVEVRFTGETPVDFALTLRVPSWADGATIEVDGEQRPAQPGAVTVRRVFAPGDVVVLRLPMSPRVIAAHPSIDAVRGQVAIERGPLVMCLESTDLPEGADTESIAIVGVRPDDTGRRALVELRPLLPAGATARWPYVPGGPVAEAPTHFEVPLLPYAQWGNRGPSTMRVWIPRADALSYSRTNTDPERGQGSREPAGPIAAPDNEVHQGKEDL